MRCGRDEAAEHLAARGRRSGRRRMADEHLERFERLCKQVRHAVAQHRRTLGRALRPAAGDRSALCAGPSGHRRDSQRPAAGGAAAVGGADHPLHPGARRAPVSSCPAGSRPSSKSWISPVAGGRRGRRARRPRVHLPQVCLSGPKSRGNSSKCSARAQHRRRRRKEKE